ncbi:MAG: ATP-binding protein [Anaerolineales bacterium]
MPIILASGLLKSWSSFIVAAFSSGIILVLALGNNLFPNLVALFLYFAVAFISWIIASNLERALSEVRLINANLDKLVQERTQALVSALGRERAEASRSRAILESIADGVIVFDLRNKATHVNPALVRLLEIPEDRLSAITAEELARAPALDAKNRGILAGLLAASGQQISSYRIQWGKKTLSVSAAQVTDINGERIGTVAVFRDYTREAEIERMKNTFLAIVSHELRTPLNAILGYAEMLKEAIYGPVNEKQVRASDRILSNVRRLLDIVNDLLDQAQIEAGKMTIQMQPFRPAALLENVLEIMNKTATDKGLALTSELDPELPETLTGDPARLQQILINLTNNAIKFTDQGSVHIRLFRPNKKQWCIEVTDTGVGIPDDELPHIFEAFRQADSTLTRRHGGFGLGLTIVQQLANLMGGAVAVKSKIGVGSVFTVTLPLVVNPPSKRRTP